MSNAVSPPDVIVDTKADVGADPSADPVELTVIIVSYNTRDLTLKCLETLYANTHRTRFHTVVFDNASADGSAAAVAEAYPQVEVIACEDNLGFAKANNLVAEQATSEWILLLNPDTEVYENGVDNLLEFSRAHPEAGLVGGRTFFPDGRLNPYSCQGKITVWSSICRTFGLSMMFRRSELFNPEAYGAWERDTARQVDLIVGCLLMAPRAVWHKLGGFDLRYYMYGEDSDLCLRATKMGYRPMICPDAKIMHLEGASTKKVRARKVIMVAKSRVTLMHDHWPKAQVPIGVALMWLWGALRTSVAVGMSVLPGEAATARARHWREIWQARKEWLTPY